MPQIIVTAGSPDDAGDTTVLRERVNATDFESDRFAANLLERLGWAVEDATAAEKKRDRVPQRHAPETKRRGPKPVQDRKPEPLGAR